MVCHNLIRRVHMESKVKPCLCCLSRYLSPMLGKQGHKHTLPETVPFLVYSQAEPRHTTAYFRSQVASWPHILLRAPLGLCAEMWLSRRPAASWPCTKIRCTKIHNYREKEREGERREGEERERERGRERERE